MQDAMRALLPDSFDPYAPMFVGALTALVILTLGWLLSKWVHRMIVKVCVKQNLDEALGRFLASIMRYAILAAAVIAALGRVGVESTSLVAILGAAGLAVGFALQGSLSNFAAGVMMLAVPADRHRSEGLGGRPHRCRRGDRSFRHHHDDARQ